VNPAHLFLGSHADNMRDMAEKGRSHGSYPPGSMAMGEEHWRARLDARAVREIRSLLSCGRRQSELAAIYGISQTAISKIKRRANWKHVA
jgi:DNA invertase Pin-like site-specific DNA recombinase